jgi:hypothetical protein
MVMCLWHRTAAEGFKNDLLQTSIYLNWSDMHICTFSSFVWGEHGFLTLLTTQNLISCVPAALAKHNTEFSPYMIHTEVHNVQIKMLCPYWEKTQDFLFKIFKIFLQQFYCHFSPEYHIIP